MGARNYSARVMRFRQGVYVNRGAISAGCQVLLLRLSDDMDAKCIVSVPRSKLAAELAAPAPRITEWIQQAREAGFLEVARRARPRVTAVYRGLYVPPHEVRPAVPLERYGNCDPSEVRPAVPLNGAGRYAQQGSQVVVPTAAIGETDSDHPEQRSQDEESA
jgi:hypothetical protein